MKRSPPIVNEVEVIGGGLAGCEASWQLASRGVHVVLKEMRPREMTPAHRSGNLAELVCSNSLKSETFESAQGLLKAELDELDSLILKIARKNRIPAGTALAVDRDHFAVDVTAKVEGHPGIRLERVEVTSHPSKPIAIISTGPLTSKPLACKITDLLGEESLYFYDAIAPTLEAYSIDITRAFYGSRYHAEKGDYLNCPLTKDEYLSFYGELVEASVVEPHAFEEAKFFSGCVPIEEIARRGVDAPRFGPMRPVGLVDPRTGKRPYAVLQLRREDFGGTMYHMVGFQTRLLYPEQERVFRLIPALEKVRFLRYGSMHRNTFINSPEVLSPFLSFPPDREYGSEGPFIFFAGQITGVEGYVESVATGLMAAINVYRIIGGNRPVCPPPTTMLGALIGYLNRTDPGKFQPMNANFGLLPPLGVGVRGKREKRKRLVQRSLGDLRKWMGEVGV